jgi:hypothetical protein
MMFLPKSLVADNRPMVMAGLDPAIHDFPAALPPRECGWPIMTNYEASPQLRDSGFAPMRAPE